MQHRPQASLLPRCSLLPLELHLCSRHLHAALRALPGSPTIGPGPLQP